MITQKILETKQRAATVMVFVILFLWGCEKIAPLPEVRIHKSTGEVIRVKVEVVRKPTERSIGLMYRKSLDKNWGMLFIMSDERKQTFTMKNTYIPLDMIFIAGDKTIAGWVENATPLAKEEFSIDKPSRFVLEVNGFFCRDKGIRVGDRVSFKNIEE